ncbi:germinal-center associated nuclear protein-like isoform X1 [Gigantopelta aegis]|uniref:germinal-center associated nuclear protein-like isoform X1 n=1 Tax=Gigantopelta aegis TaxID=1735272 RepID=UPI001B88E4AD|nr:germinal-center associated nuclear protein-like isoform X1 [Gigantopelta aegis]
MSGVFGGTDSPNLFRGNATQGQSSVFGTTTPFGQTQNQSSMQAQPSVFGQMSSPTYGNTTAVTAGVVFGHQSSSFVSSAGATGPQQQSIFGGTTFGQSTSLFGQGKESDGSKISFPFTSQTFSQSGPKQTGSGFVSNLSTGTESSSAFGGKLKMSTGFAQSPVEAAKSTVFGGQSSTDPKFVFNTSSAMGSSQPNVFGGNIIKTESVIKSEPSLFGGIGTGTGVFGGQKTPLVSDGSGGQQTALTTSIFGKTSTTASASGTQQPKYVAPSNNVFGSSSNPPQTSVSNIFGGSKTFGTSAQSAQSTSQFIFTTAAPSVASRDTGSKSSDEVKLSVEVKRSAEVKRSVEVKRSTEVKRSAEWPQKRFGRINREQPQDGLNRNSERGSRNIFSKAIAGVAKRESDSTFKESCGKISETAAETQVDECKKTFRRTSSVASSADDMKSRVAIACKGIPAQYNKGQILRRHFSKFGSVVKVFPNSNKSSAVIHFRNHDSATNAKKNGRVLAKGIPAMQIFWSSHIPKLSAASTSASDRSDKTERTTGRKEISRKSKWSADDVDDELQCMAGTSDVRHSSVRSLDRPKDSPTKKTSGFSTDSSKRSDMSSSKGDTVTLNYLAKIVAKTNQEKMQVLDQRDKLIRQVRAKQRDLVTAKAFTGACRDMCPEKERYDREDKRRLSIFEYGPGSENTPGQNPKADHARCVKEYSRASADQEEPLPHELRPEEVLVQTMTYLLKEIVDRGDDFNWCEWYQFLWDRTRGIRKEITQQQLCTPAAVGLIEKCVRFHVFCSERLCEEDMAVFDEKINNENLTKCLQTLKEFYHDLALKHAVFCPSEAEFRAYIVLMNLNEGDTLRVIQQLRPEIQNTKEVKLAIKVYNAVNSNNYVRFFRLVKEASYLSACIMHRYFNQVRQKALNTILKAYGGKNSKFPLQDLIRMLHFESSQEACHFCEFYGLDIQDDALVLDRSSFIIPETTFLPTRSRNLIELKRLLPVGEVINGEPFGPFNPPPPTFSFDSEGKFIVTDALKAQVLGTSSIQPSQTSYPSSTQAASIVSVSAVEQKHALPVADEESASKAEALKAIKTAFSNEIIKHVAKDLFIEVIDEFVLDLSRSLLQAAYEVHLATQTMAEELIEETTSTLVSEVCQCVCEEEEAARKEEYKRQERQLSTTRATESISEELMQSVVDQEVRNMVTSEVRELHAVQKRERIESCTQSISEVWIEQCVADMVNEVSSEVHQVDVVERLKQLEEIEQCVKLHRAGSFLQVWKKRYADRIKLKRAMLAFPCAPSCLSISSQLKQLLPDRESSVVVNKSMYINRCAQLNIESPMDMFHRSLMLTAQITAKCLHQHLMLQKAWQPFDLVAVVGQQIKNVFMQNRGQYLHLTVPHIFWKLVVSLPDSGDGLWSDEVNTWISAKFHRGQIPSHPMSQYKGEVLCLYHKDVELQTRLSLKLGVCVRTLIGTLHQKEVQTVKENRLLLGSSAIIFVLPEQHEKPTYWQDASERLKSVVYGKPADPALPLVIVIPQVTHERPSLEEVADNLNIQEYVVGRLIHDVHWIVIRLPQRYSTIDGILPDLSEKMSKGLQWLASMLPSAPPLLCQPVKEYVEDFLLEEYFTPVLQNLKLRKFHRLLHQGPNILITLYNNVVEHLAEVASTRDLCDYSWPVSEFVWIHSHKSLPMSHWNTSKHLSYLYEEISLLQLPRFKYKDFHSSSWDQVCEDVWSFVSAVVAQNKGKNTVNLVSRMKILLQQVRNGFEDLCFLEVGEAQCEPTYVNMPWTDVIDACINYRLTTLTMWDPHHTGQGPRQELTVYYREEDLRDYAPPESWNEAAVVSELQVGNTLESTFQKAAANKMTNWSVIVQGSPTCSDPASDDATETDMEVASFHNSDDNADEPAIPRKIPKYSQSSTRNATDLNNSSVRNSWLAGISMETETEMNLRSDCEALANSLKAEKRKSKKFNRYLESLLSSQNDFQSEVAVMSPCASPLLFQEMGDNLEGEDEPVLNKTVGERMDSLKERIASQKKQSQLFEKRLQMLINS